MRITAISAIVALVVSGGLVSTPLANEKDDIALVEQEIRAVDDAIAIHKRAKERAKTAVGKSTLGQKCQEARQNSLNNVDKAGETMDESLNRAILLLQRSDLYAEKCHIFIDRMTAIFLTDEIEKAENKKLYGLIRELKKLRGDHIEI